MKLAAGRILRASEVSGRWSPVELGQGSPPAALSRGVLVPRAVLEARTRAEEILAQAELKARQLLEQAEQRAAEVRPRLEAEARAAAAAALAARELALAAREASADARELERSTELARVLAERLLGQALRLAPELVAALARQAISEARGARSLLILAHPDDVPLLQAELSAYGVGEESVRVRADAGRARGNLRLETELGVLDAELALQLDRLVEKLRESLR